MRKPAAMESATAACTRSQMLPVLRYFCVRITAYTMKNAIPAMMRIRCAVMSRTAQTPSTAFTESRATETSRSTSLSVSLPFPKLWLAFTTRSL